MFKIVCQRGFTLVEILVVITIISILSTIAYSNYNESRALAKNEALRAELEGVQLALELYKSQYGRYPEPTDLEKDWCSSTPSATVAAPEMGEVYFSSSRGLADWVLDEETCEDVPVIANFSKFMSALPGENDEDHNTSDCTFVYLTDVEGSAYKFAALRCVLGADDPSEGVQPDDGMARCPTTCASPGPNKCGYATTEPGNAMEYDPDNFYTSYAVYSEGAECL